MVDDAADVLAASPEARALVTELRTGRRNGVVVRCEDRRPLWQYPTAAALEAAADRPQ
uniref:Uncharacterized protein n=1 Tax=Streptomyces violaceoruber TaxID=1935 RepID=Q849I9_STRVN|nr:hypothetical protein [Streptomyces violaceoruber]